MIAERVGLSGSAVRSRLNRSLDHMRDSHDEPHGQDRRQWALAAVTLAAKAEVVSSVAGLS